VVNAPAAFVENLEENNFYVLRCSENEAKTALQSGEVVAVINMVSSKAHIEVDGTDQSKASKILASVELAKAAGGSFRPDLLSDIHYTYGSADLSMFDSFGAVLIGFIVFFFVFLVAGISFLQERTTGTLEKLLSTPIKRWEIVAGYVLGFGLFTVLQAILIAWYCIYILDIMMIGSFALVLLITLLTSMSALTLGIMISTGANNEFQMIQFIPVVIIPQVFFCGLFDLSTGLAFIGRVMPVYYVADALKEIMLKGSGFSAIAGDAAVLLGFSIVFMIINTQLLKKYRRI
jgi:ABC-2 type transport system permease protein